MDRLISVLALLAWALVSCAPGDRDQYASMDQDFAGRPSRFAQAVTALWIYSYREDPDSHRFDRTSSWGEVPEKLIPDGQGGYSTVVNLLVQEETSDGPKPDRFWPLLVRVVPTADGQLTLAPNEALPGEAVRWVDPGNRAVRFRGLVKGPSSSKILWQFQGRY